MEVHHHSHIPTSREKKWAHYFWEFLMLFLAVFCGFLAEYQLEHTIEHQREKKYIQSLIADLKSDTAEIRSAIVFNVRKFHGLDTLTLLLNKEIITEEDEQQLYYLNRRYARNIFTMTFTDRTIRQLLGSGNLRLIKSQATSDSIINYYGVAKEEIIRQGELYEELSMRLIFFAEDIFSNSFAPLKMNADSSFYWGSPPANVRLMTRESNVLKKYGQMINNAQGFLAYYIEMLFGMRRRSESLLLFLQRKYHMK